MFRDFADDGVKGSDPIALFAAADGVPMGEAAKRLAHRLGLNGASRPPPPPEPKAESWTSIVPAPQEPPAKPRHRKHGAPSMGWVYRGAAGEPLFAAYRFDPAGGGRKAVLPLTFGVLDGKRAWHWHAPPEPRALFNLDQLAARPDAAVVVAEGEKSATAAARLFPECVCTTWQGGTDSVRKADWTALRGREVTLWPDNDAGGRKAAAAVAKLLAEAGAASVAAVDVPHGWPDGWDVADEPPPGVAAETLRRMLADARPVVAPAGDAGDAGDAARGDGGAADEGEARGDPAMPPGFVMRSEGVFLRSVDPEKPDILVCGPLHVVAATNDGAGRAWGVLLRWHDMDGRAHEWAMPRRMLAGDGTEVRAHLLECGLFVSPARAAREALSSYLMRAAPARRLRVVDRLGWHDTPDGRAFVLPESTLGGAGAEAVRLQTERPDALPPLRASGDLADWQREVAAPCRGNSRLIFAVSAAFAAPLLGLLGCEGGGVHLRGESSIGKSIAQHAAGSVWGGGGPRGWSRGWRTTANALEATAAAHNDLLLCLDEIGEASPETVAEAAYMLANGSGKGRAARDGSARRMAAWRVLFLSSGEVGLADRLAEARGGPRRARAGQEVRVVDVPADAGMNLGLFEDIHGAPDAAAFADAIKAAARRFHGTVGMAFLERLTAEPDDLAAAAREAMRGFEAEHVPKGAGGQVRRVAHRFALVAAGGEMAAALGVVPWAPGEATDAAARCLRDWLGARDGGAGSAEDAAAVAAVRRFLELHGEARFVPIVRGHDGQDTAEPGSRPTIQRAGFRCRDGDGAWTYWILPEVWKGEVCAGLDPKDAARALHRAGHLELGDGRNAGVRKRVPGLGLVRVYVVRGSIFDA